MKLTINTIIHLEDEEKFVLLSETEYDGGHYFLAMGVDEEKEVIPEKVAILEEIIEEEDGEEARFGLPPLFQEAVMKASADSSSFIFERKWYYVCIPLYSASLSTGRIKIRRIQRGR